MTQDEEITLKRQVYRLVQAMNDISDAIATDIGYAERTSADAHYDALLARIHALAVYNDDDIAVSQEMMSLDPNILKTE
jgi:hypothetical protein